VGDQRVGGEQAADAAADDGDMGFLGWSSAYSLQAYASATNSFVILPRPLDLGLHHVADVDEGVGALADAAAGAAHEDVAGLDAENVGGVFDLLLGREDELRGVAVLLDRAR